MRYEVSAQRLSMALDRKDMKPHELVEASGVGKSSISQYLSGKHIPGNVSAAKIGAVLGVNPVWLLGYDVPMLPPQKHYGEMGADAERMYLDEQEALEIMNRLNSDNRKRVLTYMEKLCALQIAEESVNG